jgi:hypothetical protein
MQDWLKTHEWNAGFWPGEDRDKRLERPPFRQLSRKEAREMYKELLARGESDETFMKLLKNAST